METINVDGPSATSVTIDIADGMPVHAYDDEWSVFDMQGFLFGAQVTRYQADQDVVFQLKVVGPEDEFREEAGDAEAVYDWWIDEGYGAEETVDRRSGADFTILGGTTDVDYLDPNKLCDVSSVPRFEARRRIARSLTSGASVLAFALWDFPAKHSDGVLLVARRSLDTLTINPK